jgi:hypothetical protein
LNIGSSSRRVGGNDYEIPVYGVPWVRVFEVLARPGKEVSMNRYGEEVLPEEVDVEGN